MPAEVDNMKLRIIVMNGYRLVESYRDEKWRTEKVDKANGLTPYIYNLFMAEPAEKNQQYDGVVLYVDRQFVYEIFKKGYVRHNASDFELAPAYGKRVRIAYKNQKASVSLVGSKAGRSSAKSAK